MATRWWRWVTCTTLLTCSQATHLPPRSSGSQDVYSLAELVAPSTEVSPEKLVGPVQENSSEKAVIPVDTTALMLFITPRDMPGKDVLITQKPNATLGLFVTPNNVTRETFGTPGTAVEEKPVDLNDDGKTELNVTTDEGNTAEELITPEALVQRRVHFGPANFRRPHGVPVRTHMMAGPVRPPQDVFRKPQHLPGVPGRQGNLGRIQNLSRRPPADQGLLGRPSVFGRPPNIPKQHQGIPHITRKPQGSPHIPERSKDLIRRPEDMPSHPQNHPATQIPFGSPKIPGLPHDIQNRPKDIPSLLEQFQSLSGNLEHEQTILGNIKWPQQIQSNSEQPSNITLDIKHNHSSDNGTKTKEMQKNSEENSDRIQVMPTQSPHHHVISRPPNGGVRRQWGAQVGAERRQDAPAPFWNIPGNLRRPPGTIRAPINNAGHLKPPHVTRAHSGRPPGRPAGSPLSRRPWLIPGGNRPRPQVNSDQSGQGSKQFKNSEGKAEQWEKPDPDLWYDPKYAQNHRWDVGRSPSSVIGRQHFYSNSLANLMYQERYDTTNFFREKYRPGTYSPKRSGVGVNTGLIPNPRAQLPPPLSAVTKSQPENSIAGPLGLMSLFVSSLTVLYLGSSMLGASVKSPQDVVGALWELPGNLLNFGLEKKPLKIPDSVNKKTSYHWSTPDDEDDVNDRKKRSSFDTWLKEENKEQDSDVRENQMSSELVLVEKEGRQFQSGLQEVGRQLNPLTQIALSAAMVLGAYAGYAFIHSPRIVLPPTPPPIQGAPPPRRNKSRRQQQRKGGVRDDTELISPSPDISGSTFLPPVVTSLDNLDALLSTLRPTIERNTLGTSTRLPSTVASDQLDFSTFTKATTSKPSTTTSSNSLVRPDFVNALNILSGLSSAAVPDLPSYLTTGAHSDYGNAETPELYSLLTGGNPFNNALLHNPTKNPNHYERPTTVTTQSPRITFTSPEPPRSPSFSTLAPPQIGFKTTKPPRLSRFTTSKKPSTLSLSTSNPLTVDRHTTTPSLQSELRLTTRPSNRRPPHHVVNVPGTQGIVVKFPGNSVSHLRPQVDVDRTTSSEVVINRTPKPGYLHINSPLVSDRHEGLESLPPVDNHYFSHDGAGEGSLWYDTEPAHKHHYEYDKPSTSTVLPWTLNHRRGSQSQSSTTDPTDSFKGSVGNNEPRIPGYNPPLDTGDYVKSSFAHPLRPSYHMNQEYRKQDYSSQAPFHVSSTSHNLVTLTSYQIDEQAVPLQASEPKEPIGQILSSASEEIFFEHVTTTPSYFTTANRPLDTKLLPPPQTASNFSLSSSYQSHQQQNHQQQSHPYYQHIVSESQTPPGHFFSGPEPLHGLPNVQDSTSEEDYETWYSSSDIAVSGPGAEKGNFDYYYYYHDDYYDPTKRLDAQTFDTLLDLARREWHNLRDVRGPQRLIKRKGDIDCEEKVEEFETPNGNRPAATTTLSTTIATAATTSTNTDYSHVGTLPQQPKAKPVSESTMSTEDRFESPKDVSTSPFQPSKIEFNEFLKVLLKDLNASSFGEKMAWPQHLMQHLGSGPHDRFTVDMLPPEAHGLRQLVEFLFSLQARDSSFVFDPPSSTEGGYYDSSTENKYASNDIPTNSEEYRASNHRYRYADEQTEPSVTFDFTTKYNNVNHEPKETIEVVRQSTKGQINTGNEYYHHNLANTHYQAGSRFDTLHNRSGVFPSEFAADTNPGVIIPYRNKALHIPAVHQKLTTTPAGSVTRTTSPVYRLSTWSSVSGEDESEGKPTHDQSAVSSTPMTEHRWPWTAKHRSTTSVPESLKKSHPEYMRRPSSKFGEVHSAEVENAAQTPRPSLYEMMSYLTKLVESRVEGNQGNKKEYIDDGETGRKGNLVVHADPAETSQDLPSSAEITQIEKEVTSSSAGFSAPMRLRNNQYHHGIIEHTGENDGISEYNTKNKTTYPGMASFMKRFGTPYMDGNATDKTERLMKKRRRKKLQKPYFSLVTSPPPSTPAAATEHPTIPSSPLPQYTLPTLRPSTAPSPSDSSLSQSHSSRTTHPSTSHKLTTDPFTSPSPYSFLIKPTASSTTDRFPSQGQPSTITNTPSYTSQSLLPLTRRKPPLRKSHSVSTPPPKRFVHSFAMSVPNSDSEATTPPASLALDSPKPVFSTSTVSPFSSHIYSPDYSLQSNTSHAAPPHSQSSSYFSKYLLSSATKIASPASSLSSSSSSSSTSMEHVQVSLMSHILCRHATYHHACAVCMEEVGHRTECLLRKP